VSTQTSGQRLRNCARALTSVTPSNPLSVVRKAISDYPPEVAKGVRTGPGGHSGSLCRHSGHNPERARVRP